MNKVGMLGSRPARSPMAEMAMGALRVFTGAAGLFLHLTRWICSVPAKLRGVSADLASAPILERKSFRYELNPRSLRQEDHRSLGTHLLVELYGCESRPLERVEHVESALVRAAYVANAHIVSHFFHEFEPYGVSGVVVIEESHFTIHTWPEHRYAAIDLFFCSPNVDTERAMEILREVFKPETIHVMKVQRGLLGQQPG